MSFAVTASLFSHMQIVGFLVWRLILCMYILPGYINCLSIIKCASIYAIPLHTYCRDDDESPPCVSFPSPT